MRNEVAILSIICLILASLLAVQVVHDKGLTLGQLKFAPSGTLTVQAAEKQEGKNIGNTVTNSVVTPVAVTGGNASVALDGESRILNQVFKNDGASVVQITSQINTSCLLYTSPSPRDS